VDRAPRKCHAARVNPGAAARFFFVRAVRRFVAGRFARCFAAAALGVAACGGAPTLAPAPQASAPPADPTQFQAERFGASLRALAAFGARPIGSEALARARAWAEANAPGTPTRALIVLVAPLATDAREGVALQEAGSGAALALEAARMLGARGAPVGVAFAAGETPPAPPLAGAEVAVFVRRACALPQRRDLLSHRVLRDRFFAAAGVAATEFEQVEAPHAALLAAGAKRVVALDAPAPPGSPCEPAGFAEALAGFVSDADALLARSRSNFEPLAASDTP
jgi:hypothetical protein